MNNNQPLEDQRESESIPEDPTAEERKKDHIALAFQSQVTQRELDDRFSYEPILAAHPNKLEDHPANIALGGKEMQYPIWVSSMTGGTEWARLINHNLASVCQEFGLGMGLGSCRSILFSNDRLEDFDVRRLIGDHVPLFANLGIAQMEEVKDRSQWDAVKRLIQKLNADGLIIHVNPFQEWLQPEGDLIKYVPLDIIKESLEQLDFPIIVKEVGQGMGKNSLRALMQLPLEAIDFAAAGGTNFSKLELFRGTEAAKTIFNELVFVGHTASEMVDITNDLLLELGSDVKCKKLIISGGVKSFLDGYYLTGKSKLPSVYGQASSFLKYARGDYEELKAFVHAQIMGFKLANAYLQIKM